MLMPLDHEPTFSPNTRILRDRAKTPAGEKGGHRLLVGANGFQLIYNARRDRRRGRGTKE